MKKSIRKKRPIKKAANKQTSSTGTTRRHKMTEKEARKTKAALLECIEMHDANRDQIRKHISKLIVGRADKALGYKSLKALFTDLFKDVDDHQGLYRLVHAARVEESLGLKSGAVPESVLREFGGKHKKQWADIWDTASENLDEQEYPTAGMIKGTKAELGLTNKKARRKKMPSRKKQATSGDRLNGEFHYANKSELNAVMNEQYAKVIKRVKPKEYQKFRAALILRSKLSKGASAIRSSLPLSVCKKLVRKLDKHFDEEFNS